MNYKEIKSYEDACKVLGVQPISENAVAAFPAEDRKSMLAYHKLTIIARAINGGWKPDWNNRSQYKYYPVFYYEIAGLSYASASRGFVCACVLRLSALLSNGSDERLRRRHVRRPIHGLLLPSGFGGERRKPTE